MVQADVQVLRDVRNWINHVLPIGAASGDRRAGKETVRSGRFELEGWGRYPAGGTETKGAAEPAAPHRERTGYGTLEQRLSCGAYRRRELFLFQEEPIECI